MPLDSPDKPRVLIFVVAYEAEKTIAAVLRRIPARLTEDYSVECLVIDDSSRDRTFDAGSEVTGLPFPLTVLYNPDNQGYGGNQKIGYHYAIATGFDFVALLHGDGQYAPECLPDLLEPLRAEGADAVFGSRMMLPGGARRGGMPLYKFFGNRILTAIENRMLRTRLSEFHSGYRVYSVRALRSIPFNLNSNDFHFDTEIIIQLSIAGAGIIERPIPTFYGGEICRVNGMRYAFNVVREVTRARLQEASIFYERKYDCGPPRTRYELKLDYRSAHSMALEAVEPGSAVLDLGCGRACLGAVLRKRKGCKVTGVAEAPPADADGLDEFIAHDLDTGLPPLDLSRFRYVLLLDVLEHLRAPEQFVDDLRRAAALAPDTRFIVSEGNVGFLIVRLMLLLGQFNYSKRGILDLSHTRLFTFGSLRRLFEQGGFRVLEERGAPAPYPLAVGPSRLGRVLLALNQFAIRIARRLCSYEMYFVIEPRPSLELLLRRADQQAEARRAASGSTYQY